LVQSRKKLVSDVFQASSSTFASVQNNQVDINMDSSQMKQELLVCKITHEFGRILESITDLVIISVKWIDYMQENW
jgi:hypothetical protein